MEIAILRPPNPNAQVLCHFIEGRASPHTKGMLEQLAWDNACNDEFRKLTSESTALSIRGGGGEIASNVCFMATESDGSHRISVPMLKYYKDNISTWFDMVAVYGDGHNPECSSILSGDKPVPSKSAYQAAEAVNVDSRTEDEKETIRLYKANISLKRIIAMGQSIRDPNSELIMHMIK